MVSCLIIKPLSLTGRSLCGLAPLSGTHEHCVERRLRSRRLACVGVVRQDHQAVGHEDRQECQHTNGMHPSFIHMRDSLLTLQIYSPNKIRTFN